MFLPQYKLSIFNRKSVKEVSVFYGKTVDMSVRCQKSVLCGCKFYFPAGAFTFFLNKS